MSAPGLCRCGCGRALTPAQLRRKGTYATVRCTLSAIPPQERADRARRWAQSVGYAQLREWGRKGGRSSDTARWGQLLEQWQDQSPREALHAAYARGYQAGYLAQRRHARSRARLQEQGSVA